MEAKELNPDVSDFLNDIRITIPLELKIIKGDDWSNVEKIEALVRKHNIQKKFIDRNLAHAKMLHTLAKKSEDLDNPDVKDTLDTLIEFFKIYEARYTAYVSSKDWSSLNEDDDLKIDKEISFQSDLLKNLSSYRAIIRSLDMNAEKKVGVTVYNNWPLSLVLRSVVETRNPDLKEFTLEKYKKV